MNWLAKYRPNNMDELCLDMGTKRNLMRFIFAWKEDKPIQNAMLLHSKPGLGKGSFLNVIKHEFDVNTFYFNASDLTKAVVKDVIHASQYGGWDGKLSCVVLDEIDGPNWPEGWQVWSYLNGRGSSSRAIKLCIQILDLIKYTKIPVIMTCNYIDRIPDILRKDILTLELRKAPGRTISKRLQVIAQTEGYDIPEETTMMIAKKSQSLRMAIHSLELYCMGGGKGKVSVRDVPWSKDEQILSVLRGEQPTLNFVPRFGMSLDDELMLYCEANDVPYELLEIYNRTYYRSRTIPDYKYILPPIRRLMKSSEDLYRVNEFFSPRRKQSNKKKKKYLPKLRNVQHEDDGKEFIEKTKKKIVKKDDDDEVEYGDIGSAQKAIDIW